MHHSLRFYLILPQSQSFKSRHSHSGQPLASLVPQGVPVYAITDSTDAQFSQITPFCLKQDQQKRLCYLIPFQIYMDLLRLVPEMQEESAGCTRSYSFQQMSSWISEVYWREVPNSRGWIGQGMIGEGYSLRKRPCLSTGGRKGSGGSATVSNGFLFQGIFRLEWIMVLSAGESLLFLSISKSQDAHIPMILIIILMIYNSGVIENASAYFELGVFGEGMLELLLHLVPNIDAGEYIDQDDCHSNQEIVHLHRVDRGLHVVQLGLRRHMLVEVPDRDGDLVESIDQSYDLIPFIRLLIPQEDFQGSPDTIRLHLAENTAFLTVHAVHDPRNIMDKSLELLYLGIGWSKETDGFSLLHERSRVNPHQHLPEDGGRPEILTDIVRSDGVIVDQATCHFLQCTGHYLIKEEQIVDALGVIQHT